MSEELKKLEGKTVWMRPTGNLARGKDLSVPKKAVLNKVSRVNLELTEDGCNYSQTFRMMGGAGNEMEVSGNNSGYVIYATEKEHGDHFLAVDIALRLPNYSTEWTRLGYDKLSRIKAIVDE